jgi:hypothetical protein
LVGIDAVVLVLSVNILSGRLQDPTPIRVGAASVTIVFLLLAIMLHYSSASALVSAYYESGLPAEVAVKRARRFGVVANILTFGALSALLLVAFDFSPWAIAYTLVAILACVGWLSFRRRNRPAPPKEKGEQTAS